MSPKTESRRCVCFDCDSTLSSIEGIDELAALKGCATDIEPLTTAAMEGRLKIEEIYGKRLQVLKPSRDDLIWLGRRYVATLVEGAAETVGRLKAAGVEVFVVSGGLRGPVLELARALAIGPGHVFAVDVWTDCDGDFDDYDRSSPLTRSEGKAAICAGLAQRYEDVVLVGDGVTDVAAKSAGAFVIGFGGVARREAVVEGADVFIDGPSLLAVADYLIERNSALSATV